MLQRAGGRGAAGWSTLLLLATLGVFHHANVCNGQLPQSVIDTIIQACQHCDEQYAPLFAFLAGSDTLTVNGPNATLQDIGRLLCSRLSNISSCYQDCKQGYDYQYTSAFAQFVGNGFVTEFCKPSDCDPTTIASCYASNGVSFLSGFTISTAACDPTNNSVLPSISQCIDLYEERHNCTGLCSVGSRSFRLNRLLQESVCQIPPTSALCYAAVQNCITQTFGPLGTVFATGIALTSASSDDVCSQGRRFSDCMVTAVNQAVLFGNGLCFDHSEAIGNLIAISDSMFKPFCDHPSQNFTSVCALQSTPTRSSCMKRRR